MSDFTDVPNWAGMVYLAFAIDVFARRIVGWRASQIASAQFVLDALEQAVHMRRPTAPGLIHHSDRLSPPNMSRSSTRNAWPKPA